MLKGYGQFCPIAVASEIFAQRWTPIILRELFAGSRRFNEIWRGMPLISRALLAQRLRELEAAGIIESTPLESGRGSAYQLTQAGLEFREIIEYLGIWGQRWTVRVDPENLHASFVMWNVRRRIALDRLPPKLIVVCFVFEGLPSGHDGPGTFWLLLERSGAELCVTDPGFAVDLYVEADLAAFSHVWLGDLPFAKALQSGAVRLIGPPELVRALPSWLLLSHLAGVPRPPAARPRVAS